MTDKLQLSVLIPCLNEAETLRAVIREVREGFLLNGIQGEIIVADNGSTDGCQTIAIEEGARLVSVGTRGYGATLHLGILAARSSWVLFGDADLSYDFLSLSGFIPFILEKSGSKDLVLGSRLKGDIQKGAMPFLNRYLGTPVLNMCLRILFGIRTSDCNSGMRLIRKDFYKTLVMRSHGMEWASELLIKCQLQGGRYAEIPITLRRDKRSRSSHLRPWRDGWRHLKTVILLART